MTKLMSILAASAVALSLSGVAFGADRDPYPTTQDQTGTPKTQNQGTPDQQSKQYEEYLVALKKCQDLQDAPTQQKCIEQPRQKHNQM